MARRKVNAGVVGCGYFARVQHIPNIMQSRNLRLRAICDLDQGQLDKTAKQYNPDYATQDMKVLMNDPKLDVIFAVVGHQFHADVICKLAPSGKALFIEKPMAMTMPECGRMVKAVRKYGNRLMVGFNRRFAVQLQDAKAAYEKRTGPAVITYRIATDYRRVWKNVKRRKFQTVNYGMLLDELCHIFDLLRWFTGEEPVRIYADGMDYDDTITTIRFTNNVVANIVCSANADIRYPKERLEVFRDRSTIVLDHFLELDDWYYHVPNDKRQWRNHKTYEVGAIYSDRKFGKGMPDFLKHSPARIALHDRVKLKTGNIETILPGPDKGHLREIEAYADAILAGKPSPINEVDGAAATLMGLKAQYAIDKHTVQTIKPSEYFLRSR